MGLNPSNLCSVLKNNSTTLEAPGQLSMQRTKRGFMTQELFTLVLNRLVDLVNPHRSDIPILVFSDRPACHDNAQMLDDLWGHDCHIVWFPHNSTQIVQPLDGESYMKLKSGTKLN